MPFELPISATTYDATAPTWAVDGTVHVGEEEITVDAALETFIVGEHGIYYTAEQSLYFADGDGTEQIAPIGSSELVKSPDGRYLAMIDAAHGPTDDYDTHVAVPVVFDLRTGRQVLRPGLDGSLEGQDLRDLYEDSKLGVLGFHADAVYVEDPLREGTTRFPLDGGEAERVEESADRIAKLPRFKGQLGFDVIAAPVRGGGIKLPDDPADGVILAALSPDEAYFFEPGLHKRGQFFDARTGAPISFEPGLRTFTLGGWVDDGTFFGATSDSVNEVGGPGGRTRIVSCETGSRDCALIGDEFTLQESTTFLFATGSGAL